MRAGQILDVPNATDYVFPPMTGGQVADAVAGLQAVLRAVASRVQMPEFMVTSDASNANYASTMVAEGPSVKMFERLQEEAIRDDLIVIDRAMDCAMEANVLPSGIKDAIEVQASAPQLTVRDKAQESTVKKTEHEAGVLSLQTWTQESGYDFEQEQRNIKDGGGVRTQPITLQSAFGGVRVPAAPALEQIDIRAAIRDAIWEAYPYGRRAE
jgi:hypothetical protein